MFSHTKFSAHALEQKISAAIISSVFFCCCLGKFGFYLLSLACMSIYEATKMNARPVMPLKSLSDSGIPGWPQVTRSASTAKIIARALRQAIPLQHYSSGIFA
jgi:hypothetical protein